MPTLENLTKPPTLLRISLKSTPGCLETLTRLPMPWPMQALMPAKKPPPMQVLVPARRPAPVQLAPVPLSLPVQPLEEATACVTARARSHAHCEAPQPPNPRFYAPHTPLEALGFHPPSRCYRHWSNHPIFMDRPSCRPCRIYAARKISTTRNIHTPCSVLDPHIYPPTSFCLKFGVHSLHDEKKFQKTVFLHRRNIHYCTHLSHHLCYPAFGSPLLPCCRRRMVWELEIRKSSNMGVDFLDANCARVGVST